MGFKKCKEKLVEKISAMCDSFFYIGFIIKCELIELVECGTYIIIYGKNEVWLLIEDGAKWKSDS